ncbi:TetR family transcriptional regulator [Sinomonas atrocyanea]|uniref:TetR family transcriptional regulator n=1 Tax=Sinomonas atrocyanea TaxID=37927 RepID=A0A127A2X9_9MICC|nr:TetR/AcrR family transcriptional regulator [Sinomonas atrocyanea]AMM33154.1 TetR family transcriptional regulator [Sinomonas atrocyanea]GEB63967.1 transcriptional regulator [Sinomonas atrocyanea]GGG76599.1 transcriptional regulator [Sinomonas atrocyanea]
MPKIVDHDQRRLELVDATWRVIAERGLDAATMREIASAAGFANGALKPYFTSKDGLLDFAFEHVFARTNRRMEAATAGLSGRAALRAYCHEILPLDDDRLAEARVAIAFWSKAVRDPEKAALHERSMDQWRSALADLLRGAGFSGGAAELDSAVGAVMDLVLGAQITATLSPARHGAGQLVAQLDLLLDAFLREEQS